MMRNAQEAGAASRPPPQNGGFTNMHPSQQSESLAFSKCWIKDTYETDDVQCMVICQCRQAKAFPSAHTHHKVAT
jgi:hypothetical protein